MAGYSAAYAPKTKIVLINSSLFIEHNLLLVSQNG